MGRQYPRFLYSNPQNTKSTGPFIIHTLDPFAIIKVSVLPPEAFFTAPKFPYLTDDHFLYEAVLTKAETVKQTLTIIDFAIEWFQGQEEYKTSFTHWFYNLVDDNGANSYSSYYKFDIGGKFIYYGYLYEVTEYYGEDMIMGERCRMASTEEKALYPLFGPQD